MYNVNVSFRDEVVFFSVENLAYRLEVTFRELRSSAKTCTAMYEDQTSVSHYTLTKDQANHLFKLIQQPA